MVRSSRRIAEDHAACLLEVFRRHRAIVKVPPRNLNKAVANARRVALPTGSSLRAIEAPKPVVHGVVLDNTVKKEAR